MKKIISLVMILATLISLSSCNKYEPVPSTEEESRVVMTMSFDGEKYDVKYELYRALFLTYKSAVDNGDASVWSGENKSEYIEKIHGMIVARVADIYAALHHAKELGINMYSNKINSQIDEYIKLSVEGGVFGGETIIGYGSYDAYLESLAQMGMNYSVSDLIYRYGIAIDLISEHYTGTLNQIGTAYEGGALKYTKDDVKNFYFGDDSVRCMRAFIQSEYAGAYDRAVILRNAMLVNEGNDDKVANTITGNTISSGADVKRGTIIARYSLDEENYGAMTEAAFSTPISRVSEIIEITAGSEPGFYVLYPIAKTDSHFEESYAEISAVYVENEIGKLLVNIQASLTESILVTDILGSLDYSQITNPTINKK